MVHSSFPLLLLFARALFLVDRILFGWVEVQLSLLMYIISINVHIGFEEFILFEEEMILQPWEILHKKESEPTFS